MSTSISPGRTLPGCVQHAPLFQDPLLEEPPNTNAPAQERKRYAALTREADGVCRACPVLSACLYSAVVQHDVTGFVAATTAKQRLTIRRRLAVRVEPEDFDTLAGAARQHRQVDHDEVVRLHRANPDQTYEQLAERLGCSLSTVKRHLRTARKGRAVAAPARRPRPTEAAVAAVFAELVDGVSWDQRPAA